jgi:hypothetical protein
LTAEYLSDKTIGVLANARSESGHVCPMGAIRRERVDQSGIKYHASHRDLRSALENGQVEIIGSYWGKEDREKYPEWKYLKIGDIDNGDYWYLLDKKEFNDDLCQAVVETLGSIAGKSKEKYWKEITLLDCGL